MTNKLTVILPDGQEIEVEEGDRFYLKDGIYSFDRVAVIKRQALDIIGYNFDPDGEPRWFTLGKIDFTRPAPDEDGWIKLYNNKMPTDVDENDIVELEVTYNGCSTFSRATGEAFLMPWENGIDMLHRRHKYRKENLRVELLDVFGCKMLRYRVIERIEQKNLGNRPVDLEDIEEEMRDHLNGMSIKQANDKINEEAEEELKSLAVHGVLYSSMADIPQSAVEEVIGVSQVGGSHYQQFKIQPHVYAYENKLGFHEGNIIKYVTRHRLKGGKQDLEKAKDFINKLIDLEYEND